jgi:hypothetical protein
LDKKYTIKDDGKGNYTVIDHNEPERPKEQIDTEKLLAEARSMIEYNKRQREKAVPKQEQKPQQKQFTVKDFVELTDQAERMARVNKRKQIFLPDNIFDY